MGDLQCGADCAGCCALVKVGGVDGAHLWKTSPISQYTANGTMVEVHPEPLTDFGTISFLKLKRHVRPFLQLKQC